MAEGNDASAQEHAVVLPQPAIRDQTPKDCAGVDATRVVAIDRCGMSIRKTKPPVNRRGSHIEDEERAHTVITEAFPHLGEKQRRDAARMSCPTGCIRVADGFLWSSSDHHLSIIAEAASHIP